MRERRCTMALGPDDKELIFLIAGPAHDLQLQGGSNALTRSLQASLPLLTGGGEYLKRLRPPNSPTHIINSFPQVLPLFKIRPRNTRLYLCACHSLHNLPDLCAVGLVLNFERQTLKRLSTRGTETH